MTSLDRVIAAAEAVLPHFQPEVCWWNGHVIRETWAGYLRKETGHYHIDFLAEGARILRRLDAPGPTWANPEIIKQRSSAWEILGGRMLLLLQPDMQGRVRAMPNGPELIASMEAWLNAEGRENFTVLGAST